MSSATEFLLHSQNADGGWGYRPQGMSYVEPTAAVMLALRDDSARQRARRFLLSIQQADGGWGIGALDDASGWMTAWAILGLNETTDPVMRGVEWLRATEGIRVTDESAIAQVRRVFKMDATLHGFPWQPGDASWVHPTALAMLALCAVGKRDDVRVRQGAAFLYDRAMHDGGWNVGNPEMLGKSIPATIQDTAVALLALRAAGENVNQERIVQALAFLRRAIAQAQTPSELAWGMWALRNWNADTGNWKLEIGNALARLNDFQLADSSWQGNPFITAIALLASQT